MELGEATRKKIVDLNIALGNIIFPGANGDIWEKLTASLEDIDYLQPVDTANAKTIYDIIKALERKGKVTSPDYQPLIYIFTDISDKAAGIVKTYQVEMNLPVSKDIVGSEKKKLVSKVKLEIGGRISPTIKTTNTWNNLLMKLETGKFLPPDLIAKSKNIFDIFTFLETKGKVTSPKYHMLIPLFEGIDEKVVDILKEFEENLATLDSDEEDTKQSKKRPTESLNTPEGYSNSKRRKSDDNSDVELVYDRESTQKPIMQIFNLKFKGQIKERTGTDKDDKELREFFGEKLKYKIFRPKDYDVNVTLGESEMKKRLQNLNEELSKKEEAAKYSSLFTVLMSHGSESHNGDLYIATEDGGKISLKDVCSYFVGSKLETFRDKPKVFLVQACRKVKSADGDLKESDFPGPFTLPDDANILIAYATTSDNYSYRDIAKGTDFIRLCLDVFRKNYEKYDIEQMLRTVRYRFCTGSMADDTYCDQMPCLWTSSMKALYLHK